ncbi:hypothetical protein [Streptococcus iniae]|uniref:hypothetical protein n=1 Tax=Streptococcus iniae TaxID=1346 RepID=UPI000EF7D9CA|nr:hypothetical protein [Streptococcus iniae]RLV14241.1 hypothetical protein DIX80_02105 [Streptococcus iniae]
MFDLFCSILEFINWSDYLTWLSTILTSWLVLRLLSFKKVKIQGINVNKIEDSIKPPLFFINNCTEHYYDGVFNEMIVFNPNDEVLINTLEIELINVVEYNYHETSIKVSFDEENQNINIIQVNNGSLKNISETITVSYYEFEINKEIGKLKESNIKTSILNSGDIKLLRRESLESLKKNRNYLLVIKISNEQNEILSQIPIQYSSEKDIFEYCGGIGGGIEDLINKKIPIYAIKNIYEEKKLYNLTRKLNKGINIIEYIFITNFPVEFSYKITLKGIEGKEIASYHSKNTKIKFQKYKMTSPLNNEFDSLFKLEYGKNLYTYHELKELEKNSYKIYYINDIERIKGKLIN